MREVENVLNAINMFSLKKDGTYDMLTGIDVEYGDGYQVSFVRPEAFSQLSSSAWDDITNYFCTYFQSAAHIGVYGGSPEVSFHSMQRDKAMKTMDEFNQESILNWKEKSIHPESIERWFIFNRNFDEKLVINYEKVLSKIH